MGRASATATPPYGDAHGQCLAAVPARKGCPVRAFNSGHGQEDRLAWPYKRSLSCCSWSPGVTHLLSHARVQLSSLRWARSMVAERGVRRGVAGRGRRQLRAFLTGPRRVFKAGPFDGRGARSSARSCRPGQTTTPRPFDSPPQGFQGVKGARSSGGPGEIKILQGPTTWQAWATPRLQHQQLRTHNSHALSAL